MTTVHAIYAIANTVNGHLYIGSATNRARRWDSHRSYLRLGKHPSLRLQRAYDKYGKDALEFQVVEYVDDPSRLLEREQVWLDFFKPAYNTAKFAGSPTKGLKFSAETRAKMSAAQKGRKRPPRSQEWRDRLAASKRAKPMSPEGLASMRAKRQALFADPAYREAWSALRRGRSPSEETREKVRRKLLGNKHALGFKHAPGVYANRRRKPRGPQWPL